MRVVVIRVIGSVHARRAPPQSVRSEGWRGRLGKRGDFPGRDARPVACDASKIEYETAKSKCLIARIAAAARGACKVRGHGWAPAPRGAPLNSVRAHVGFASKASHRMRWGSDGDPAVGPTGWVLPRAPPHSRAPRRCCGSKRADRRSVSLQNSIVPKTRLCARDRPQRRSVPPASAPAGRPRRAGGVLRSAPPTFHCVRDQKPSGHALNPQRIAHGKFAVRNGIARLVCPRACAIRRSAPACVPAGPSTNREREPQHLTCAARPAREDSTKMAAGSEGWGRIYSFTGAASASTSPASMFFSLAGGGNRSASRPRTG